MRDVFMRRGPRRGLDSAVDRYLDLRCALYDIALRHP